MNQIQLVVVVHGPFTKLLRAANAMAIPCIWMYGHPFHLNGWTQEEAKVTASLMQLIIAQSGFLASTLPFAKDRVCVIPNGANLGHFSPLSADERKSVRVDLGISNETFVIGYPARFVEYKRHEVLKESFAVLKESIQDSTLFFIGGESSDLPPGVHSVRVEPSQMRSVMGICDLAVFPAFDEGYGCAVAESIALGIPVLINKSGGHREFLPIGQDFFYEDLGNGDLGQKLIHLAQNKDLRSRMAKRAVEYSKDLDARFSMHHYLEAFHDSISKCHTASL